MTDNQTPVAGDREALADLETKLFEFLVVKYVQRADARQLALGLQYTEAETHDLAKTLARFLADQWLSAKRGEGFCSEFTSLPASAADKASTAPSGDTLDAAKKLLCDVCACAAESDSLDLPHVIKDCVEPIATLIAERNITLAMLEHSKRFMDPSGPFDTIGLLRELAEAKAALTTLPTGSGDKAGSGEVDRCEAIMNELFLSDNFMGSAQDTEDLAARILAALAHAEKGDETRLLSGSASPPEGGSQ